MQSGNKFFILTGVVLAMFLSSLDQTIVATAMPKVVQDLNGIEHLSWVFTAYMLASTVTVPVYGKLSDIFGRRRLYFFAIVIFLVGSALCGLAQSMNQLILFRALQGIGGGAMMVNSFAIIGDVFPPAERGKYQGYIGGVFGLSSVAGPLLGGWITDNFSWRWIFYVNLPLGIIALVVLSAAIPKLMQAVSNKKIDFAGTFFIAATLIPLLLALVWGGSLYPWSSGRIIALLVVSLFSLVAFLFIESRVSNPILSLKLFQNRVFVISVCSIFLTAMGMFGAIIYVPIFGQGVVGISATHSGLILTPLMLALVTTSTVSGQIISRTGKYKLIAVTGMAITVFAMFFFTGIGVNTTNNALILRMIVMGIGLGSTMPIFTLAIQSAFGREKLGEVTAASQLFRNVGGTVGTAVLGGIMNSRLAKEMTNLTNEPFVASIRKINPAAANVDGSLIQKVLSPDNRAHISAMMKDVPSQQQTGLTGSFNHFLGSARLAYSHSIDRIFLISGFIMCIALLLVIFLPEIPLRKSHRAAIEEFGVQMEGEFSQADDERQCEEFDQAIVRKLRK